MPHRTVFKKQARIYLEEVDDTSEELEELRWEKWCLAQEEEQRQQDKIAAERWQRYFFADASCRAHDRNACRECRHYATGGCPSYWEEKE